jgi:hypothetical protein
VAAPAACTRWASSFLLQDPLQDLLHPTMTAVGSAQGGVVVNNRYGLPKLPTYLLNARSGTLFTWLLGI